jgi:hypothetical protein
LNFTRVKDIKISYFGRMGETVFSENNEKVYLLKNISGKLLSFPTYI